MNRSNSGASAIKDNSVEIRAKALDQLAEIMMTEEGGLLQQFVEYSVTPIIRSCVAKFEDEKSWARASQFNLTLDFTNGWLTLHREVSSHLIRKEVLC